MAGCSSHRSASPMSNRLNPNQILRSHRDPERDHGVLRKSFSGNPTYVKPSRSIYPCTTPANSPASDHGIGRRFSLGRGSVVSSENHDQKENEKDHNLRPSRAPYSRSRSRSPSKSLSKGTKNFMSPTISAASKINASPKKKILAERNEVVRASASLSDEKFHFFSVDALVVADDGEIRDSTYSHQKLVEEGCTFSSNNVGIGGMASKTLKLEEPDLVVLSPEIPLDSTQLDSLTLPKTPNAAAAASSPSLFAPLDADDPSLRPYDPNTNYLSPRPQFLHYKPNPRIELYHSSGKRLEDNFFAETETETKSSHETSQSEDSQKECEDASSVEMALAPEESPNGTMRPLMMPMDAEKECVEMTPEEEPKLEFSEPDEIVERNTESKPHFISSSKAIIALLFLFSLAFLPIFVLHTPNSISLSLNDTLPSQTISKLYNDSRTVAGLAVVNFNDLLPNVVPWPVQARCYFSQMSSRVREIDSLLQFKNSTSVHVHDADFRYHEVDHTGLVPIFDGGIELGSIKGIDPNPVPVPEWKNNLEIQNLRTFDRGEEMDENSGGAAFFDTLNEWEYDPDHANESSSTLAELGSCSIISEMFSSEQAADLPEHENLEAGEKTQESQDSTSNMQDEQNSGAFLASLNESSSTLAAEGSEMFSSEQVELPASENLEAAGGKNQENQDSTSSMRQDEQHNDDVEANQLTSPSQEDHLDSCIGIEPEKSTEEVVKESSLVMEDSTGNHQIVDALSLGKRFLDPGYLGIYLLGSSLLATAAALTILKRKKPFADHEDAFPLFKELPAEKDIPTPVASVVEPSLHGSPFSHSGPVEVDMGSEPCPSEMSSFQKSTSCYSSRKGVKVADEVQSQERRKPRRSHKRESLASSSEYTVGSSTSYGSFTTYGIIHSKNGDEEVVTPVRRSSRIRSHISPLRDI
ncbi:hypothetical protein Dimus_003058 [Dionaea muscipula]